MKRRGLAMKWSGASGARSSTGAALLPGLSSACALLLRGSVVSLAEKNAVARNIREGDPLTREICRVLDGQKERLRRMAVWTRRYWESVDE